MEMSDLFASSISLFPGRPPDTNFIVSELAPRAISLLWRREKYLAFTRNLPQALQYLFSVPTRLIIVSKGNLKRFLFEFAPVTFHFLQISLEIVWN
jgi:hypothetical protein